MSKHKKGYQPSTDTIEPKIINELEAAGFSVEKNHDDILVGRRLDPYTYRPRTDWVEIKNKSPFGLNGKILEGVIRDSQFRILWNYTGQYNICWTSKQIENIGVYDGVLQLTGLTPALFRANFQDYLTPKMLKYLREEKILNF